MTRTVRAACPHDCPDTCAMLVTVDEDGRATAVAGNPDQPVTAGFLCGKVSNYLDRVYAEDRLLHPLVRTGPKGAGEFRRASWDEALDRVAEGLRGRDRRARRRGGPALQLHGHDGAAPGRLDERAGDERARRHRARAHDLRDRRDRPGVAATHGDLAGGRPRALAARALPAAVGLEPDVHRAAPVAAAAGGPAQRRAARGGRSVPQPHRPGGRRAPAAAARHRRRAGARDDARGRGRRAARRGVVPRAHHRLRRAARAAGRAIRSSAAPRSAASTPTTIARRRARVRHRRSPRCCASAWARSATRARRRPTARSPACRRWPARGATRAAAARTSRPPRRPRCRPDAAHAATTCGPGDVRPINMSQLGDALTDPGARSAGQGARVLELQPRAIAPDQGRVLEGLRRDDLFTVVLEQFMTDTAAPRRRRAAGHHPARAPRRRVLVGPPLLHAATSRAIEPVGEAKPNTEAFRLIAARMGLDDPCFSRDRRGAAEPLLADGAGRRRRWTRCARAGSPRSTSARAHAARRGRVRHRRRQARVRERVAGRGRDRPAAPLRPAGRGGRRRAGRAVPARADHAQDAPVPQLARSPTRTASTARSPSPSWSLHPADAAARGLADGARARVFNDRGSFVCPARVSDDARPGVLVAPMGWWNGDYEGGASGQATTSQRADRRWGRRRSSTTTGWRWSGRRGRRRRGAAPIAMIGAFSVHTTEKAPMDRGLGMTAV